MTQAEIEALPVSDMAEADAHLWLWVMNSNVPDGWKVAQAWGFQPQTMVTWCKTQPGVGQWFRNNTEHLLFCTRGRPLTRQTVPTSTWIVCKRGEHSAKPEVFLDLVEQVSPGPYLELFARRNRLGWDTWGNECLDSGVAL
jgi:N6-adenosine-specific RNA methylase IME4